MPESLFGVLPLPYVASQQRVTDTAAAAITSSVPMYFIHSFERPFCGDANCSCHMYQQEVVRLLVSIIEGRVELEPAAALLTMGGKEPHA